MIISACRRARSERASCTCDVVRLGPQVRVNDIEDTEQSKAPRDAVNDGALAAGEELVDDRAEEQEVDERPEKLCQCLVRL